MSAAASQELPTTTAAWRIHRTGPVLDNIRLDDDVPVPPLKAGQALVEIHSVGLNPSDWKAAEIFPSFWQPLPRTMGSDFSGRLIAFEAATTPLSFTPAVDQDVFGLFPVRELSARGSLSRYAVADLRRMTTKPSNVDAAVAGGLAITGMTALKLAQHAKKGDKVLLLGATTTVGLLLADLLKSPLVEASHVCGTASGGKLAFLGERGKVDEMIDYRKDDVEAVLEEKYGDAPFDIILDCVGSPRTLERCEAFLKPWGSYLNVGASAGQSGRFIFSMLPLVKAVLKTTLLPRFLGGISRKYANVAPSYEAEDWKQLSETLEKGHMQPVTDSTYSFEEVKEAYNKLIAGRAMGKIMINVRGGVEGASS